MKKVANRIVLGAMLIFGFSPLSWSVPVDLELVLLNDVSGNVNAIDYNLEKEGFRDAFQSIAVQRAIASGALGAIAVTYIEWSGPDQQEVSVGWTLIDDIADANAFGAAIFDAPRAFDSPLGRTAPGSALNFAISPTGGAGDRNSNGFEGTRSVINVSGNGVADGGDDTSAARDAALDSAGAGIAAINGLVVGRTSAVLDFYTANVIGGTDNPFITVAPSFADFGSTLNAKLIREITGTPVPVPGTFVLLAMGILGLGSFAKRNSG